MKEKLYLDHLNPSFYRKMRETIVTGSPDFLFLVKNGYKKMFHVDLLTLLSTVIHNHIRSCRADGFKGDSIMLPSLGKAAIDCLHELIYKDVCEVDKTLVNEVVKDLTELGFSVSDQPSDSPLQNEAPNDVQPEAQNDAPSDVHNDVPNDVPNDSHSDRHSDGQNDGLNDVHHEVNNNVHNDTYSPEPPASTGKKPRGCKVKYPLSPAQEELVKFYRLIEESLPNPKPYFVGKDIRCFHCNQLYPKVRLWRDHIMNDHYHRAQTCENCGEIFTYTFYLHRRTCSPAGGKEN